MGLEEENFQRDEKGLDEIHQSHILATNMKPLTKPERIALLEEWLKEFQRVEAACSALEALFGKDHEGRIQMHLHGLFESYSRMVAIQVGDKDKWLDWFLWDNYCGKKALEAKAPSWKKSRKIRTVKDLEAIISAK